MLVQHSMTQGALTALFIGIEHKIFRFEAEGRSHSATHWAIGNVKYRLLCFSDFKFFKKLRVESFEIHLFNRRTPRALVTPFNQLFNP